MSCASQGGQRFETEHDRRTKGRQHAAREQDRDPLWWRRRYRQRRGAGVRARGGAGLPGWAHIGPLDAIASDVVSAGGHASTAQVDATDPKVVEAHFASVVDQAGGVDMSFNMIALRDVQGQELAVLPLDDYMRPIELAARTISSPRPLPPGT
jgi:hypothetical protein